MIENCWYITFFVYTDKHFRGDAALPWFGHELDFFLKMIVQHARVAVAHLLCKFEELVLGGGLSVSIERD